MVVDRPEPPVGGEIAAHRSSEKNDGLRSIGPDRGGKENRSIRKVPTHPPAGKGDLRALSRSTLDH